MECIFLNIKHASIYHYQPKSLGSRIVIIICVIYRSCTHLGIFHIEFLSVVLCLMWYISLHGTIYCVNSCHDWHVSSIFAIKVVGIALWSGVSHTENKLMLWIKLNAWWMSKPLFSSFCLLVCIMIVRACILFIPIVSMCNREEETIKFSHYLDIGVVTIIGG